jgi:hypothetical protein
VILKEIEMIILEADIKKASQFFNSSDERLLIPYATEMNRTNPTISLLIKELERSGISGIIIDELMLSIIIVWYVVVKLKHKRIEPISENDIKRNVELFQSFIKYFNESDSEEISYLNFIKHEEYLLIYSTEVLQKVYNDPMLIPKEVVTIYFAIMKCFEDKLEYTRIK